MKELVGNLQLVNGEDTRLIANMLDYATHYLNLEGLPLFDAGAGIGHRVPAVISNISEYYSCDLNPDFAVIFNEALEELRRKFNGKILHEMIASPILELQGEGFGSILLHHVLCHMGGPEVV